MSIYINFILDVAAVITAHLICKWLDIQMGDK